MSAAEYAVVDPATGDRHATYATIGDEALKAAIGRAHDAHALWSRDTSLDCRAAILGRVGDLYGERRGELAGIIVREMGKLLTEALAEVDFSATIYRYYADNAATFLADEPIELLAGEGSASSGARRSECSLASCRGTSPTTRWHGSLLPTSRWGTPSSSSTRRSARSRPP